MNILRKKFVLAVLLVSLGCILAADSREDKYSQNGVKLIKNSRNLSYKLNLAPGVVINLIWIKPGSFLMGSPENELGRWAGWGEIPRKVVISRPFYIAAFETTQAQFEAVMDFNPSKFKGRDNPVEMILWKDAMDFCSRLNKMTQGQRPKGYKFSLPTEAQWEYACRAGTGTALNNGTDLTNEEQCKNLDKLGWYRANSDGHTHEVGEKCPNAWGLYDMHGNVWEYCLDVWEKNPSGKDVVDPQGPENLQVDPDHVKKGGGFYLAAKRCRSASRSPQKNPTNYIGMRIAMVYDPDEALPDAKKVKKTTSSKR